MPLKLRPTGLGSGIDKDRPDYTVYTGERGIGRIYETRGGPDNLFWSMTVNGPMTRAGRVATLEEAKARFQTSWDAWKAWAKQEEVPQSRLRKQRRLLAEHFVARLLCRLATIVFQHEQPEHRREITVLPVRAFLTQRPLRKT